LLFPDITLSMKTHRISIIGAGFGALATAKKLRKLNSAIEITLIAPKAEFIYLPSLIWLPSGLRSGNDLRISLEKFFKRYHLKFHQAVVTGISDDGRLVSTNNGDIANDGLVIASGARFIKKLPGIEHALTLCEGIESTEKITKKFNELDSGVIALGFSGNPKEPSAMRGGPMFELLFGIDTMLRQQKRRDNFDIVFFSPAPKPGKRLGEKAVDSILAEMNKRNIKTSLGSRMVGFETNKVITEADEIDADLIVFMPGMTGPQWITNTSLPLSAGGMIVADKHTRVSGFNKVYVVGDSGSFPGPDWMPKQAHMADLQGAAAAKNLLAELENQSIRATYKVELLCIIDSLDKGILVYRSENRKFLFASRLLHTAKKFFEWWYLRQFN